MSDDVVKDAKAEKRFQLRERVYATLTEAGVDMPLETIQLAAMDVKVHPNGT